jgi:hypothetical protein
MLEVFLDLSLGSGGSGVANDPFGDSRSIKWSNNLRLRFLRGKTHKLRPGYAGLDIPEKVTGGLEITDYGDAEERATLDGSLEYSNWTRYSGNIWFVSGVPDIVGVVLEDGIALNWVHGGGGISAFISQMSPGSYAYDHNGSIYVWLRDGGNPNDASRRIEVSSTRIGINCNFPLSDFQVNNLRIIGCSRQGSNIQNVRNAEFINNFVQYCGGAWDAGGGYYLGGGLQVVGGCRNVLYERNICVDVYDSPISPQTPKDNTTIENIIIRRNVLGNFALGGVEVANWRTNTLIKNVLIENNHIYGGGRGWSGTGDNDDNTEGVIINGRPAHQDIRIIGNIIQDIDHSGIKVRDAQATGIQIARNQISGCRIGVNNFAGKAGNQEVDVSFNEITNCSDYGILHDQRLGQAVCKYRKNTLVNNGIANLGLLRVNTKVPVVKDNNCYGGQYGIQKTGNLTVNPQFNNAYGASGQNYNGVRAGQTNLSVDPAFKDISRGDYQLLLNSALVDAGSGTSPGNDIINQSYSTDDIGCHAVVHQNVDISSRIDLKLLTS